MVQWQMDKICPLQDEKLSRNRFWVRIRWMKAIKFTHVSCIPLNDAKQIVIGLEIVAPNFQIHTHDTLQNSHKSYHTCFFSKSFSWFLTTIKMTKRNLVLKKHQTFSNHPNINKNTPTALSKTTFPQKNKKTQGSKQTLAPKNRPNSPPSTEKLDHSKTLPEPGLFGCCQGCKVQSPDKK